jgi:type II secretory pathway component PulJ
VAEDHRKWWLNFLIIRMKHNYKNYYRRKGNMAERQRSQIRHHLLCIANTAHDGLAKNARKIFKQFLVRWSAVERLYSETVRTMKSIRFVQERMVEGWEKNKVREKALEGIWWSRC